MKRVLVVGVALLGACGPRPAEGAELPPLKLTPAVPRFTDLAAAVGADPSESARKELAELVELAFGSGGSRLAARSERALLEREDRAFAFEQGLLHDDAAIRSRCAYELGNAGSRAAVPPLLLRLKYEKDARVRIWVASALAALGNGAGLAVLVESLAIQELADEAGRAALDACKRAGRELGASPTWAKVAETLTEIDRAWRASGNDLVAPTKPAADETRFVARLARHMLATDGFQLRPVDEARFVVARAGRTAFPLLRTALAAEETYLRNHALEVVIAIGPAAQELAPAVLPLVRDRLSALFAIQALGALGFREALPHLVTATRSLDPELRSAGVTALGDLGDDRGVPRLEAVLRDAQEAMDVRVRAAASLACLQKGGAGLAFLEERKRLADYHEPTIALLLERVARRQ